MTEHESYDIDLSRDIDAPPTRVYRAFIDPDQFATWYGPTGFPVERASVELDARVGGPMRFAMVGEADPSTRTAFDGTYVEVIEDELLMSSGAWTGIPGQAGGWPSNLRAESTPPMAERGSWCARVLIPLGRPTSAARPGR